MRVTWEGEQPPVGRCSARDQSRSQGAPTRRHLATGSVVHAPSFAPAEVLSGYAPLWASGRQRGSIWNVPILRAHKTESQKAQATLSPESITSGMRQVIKVT